MKVPKPQSYNETHNAKVVKNFLFDIEQHTDNFGIKGHKSVVTNAMYLIGDAKLWWRIKYTDMKEERLQLET